MVDNFQEKNLGDFMHTNFGGHASTNEPKESMRTERNQSITTYTDENQSKLRKYSNTVKDILSETKQALSLGLNNEEE